MGRCRYRDNDCESCFTAASPSWFPSAGIAAQHCEQSGPQSALEMSREEQRALFVTVSTQKHMYMIKENWSALHGSCSPRLFTAQVLVESDLQDYKEREVLEQEHEKNGDVIKVLKLGQVQKMKHFSIAVLVDGFCCHPICGPKMRTSEQTFFEVLCKDKRNTSSLPLGGRKGCLSSLM